MLKAHKNTNAMLTDKGHDIQKYHDSFLRLSAIMEQTAKNPIKMQKRTVIWTLFVSELRFLIGASVLIGLLENLSHTNTFLNFRASNCLTFTSSCQWNIKSDEMQNQLQ